MWLLPVLEAVKVSPLIEKVSDHKDFKKLLRTRTNVLVLYTKTGQRGHPLKYTSGSACSRYQNMLLADIRDVVLCYYVQCHKFHIVSLKGEGGDGSPARQSE